MIVRGLWQRRHGGDGGIGGGIDGGNDGRGEDGLSRKKELSLRGKLAKIGGSVGSNGAWHG